MNNKFTNIFKIFPKHSKKFRSTSTSFISRINIDEGLNERETNTRVIKRRRRSSSSSPSSSSSRYAVSSSIRSSFFSLLSKGSRNRNKCIFSHRCYETGGDIIIDRQTDKQTDRQTDKSVKRRREIGNNINSKKQSTLKTDVYAPEERWCAFDVAQFLCLYVHTKIAADGARLERIEIPVTRNRKG